MANEPRALDLRWLLSASGLRRSIQLAFSLGALMLSRANNFDALRLYAAFAVLWSHTVPLTQGAEKNELFFRLSGGQTTTGTVAVFVFFAMSGYLITRSFERASSPWEFAWARIVRIMPALVVVLLLTALVVGPLESTRSPGAYFSSSEPYRYLATQGSFFFGWCNALPGVWEHNPMPGINGSVWTLKYEAECYGLVFLLGVAGLLRKQIVLALYVLALVALMLFPGTPGTADLLPDPNAHLDLGAAFLAGAVIQQWSVPLNGKVAAVCAVIAAIACASGQMLWAQRTVVPYLVLYVAVAPTAMRLPRLRGGLDISYGLYLCAWPVSQLIVAHMDQPRWFELGLIASPIALTFGWLSWHLVEKRALTLKSNPPHAVDEDGRANHNNPLRANPTH